MKILALDTCSDYCSVALDWDGQVVTRGVVAPRRHTELILPMVQELLNEVDGFYNQIDIIGFGRGPGSFTGIRIATSVAQGLSAAYDIPVVPVSTLHALSYQAYREHLQSTVLALLDARMHQVYCAGYVWLEGKVTPFLDEAVCDVEQINFAQSGQVAVIGDAWATYGEVLMQKFPHLEFKSIFAQPDAKYMLEYTRQQHLAKRSVDASLALPIYLRDKIC